MRRVLAVCLALVVVGCGDDEGRTGSSLVDPAKKPLINSLSVAPGGAEFLITTNRGLFRINGGEASRIPARVRTPEGSSPVGKFLAIRALPGGRLIGSGHPDRKGLAAFLGLLRSADGGRNWEVVSRYGLADLHVIRPHHDLLFAYDAFLGGLLISRNEGRSWSERGSPPGQVFDFVVDPGDPNHLVASTAEGIFSSTDQARSWQASAGGSSARLAWPDEGPIYRADEDGLVYESSGGTWELIGRIEGEPWKLEAVGEEELYAALADATIVRSTDGGRNWEEVFVP